MPETGQEAEGLRKVQPDVSWHVYARSAMKEAHKAVVVTHCTVVPSAGAWRSCRWKEKKSLRATLRET